MIKHLTFALPGSIDFISGGTIYDKNLLATLRDRDWLVDLIELAGDFPLPSPDDLKGAQSKLRHVTGPLIVDGLAFGGMASILPSLKAQPLIDLLHHPLCLENGLDPKTAHRLEIAERQALTFADHTIVTSPVTREEIVTRFELDPENISVALPGTDKRAIANGGATFTMIYPAAFIPRKNHTGLIEALSQLKDLSWHLILAGNNSRHDACNEAINDAVHAHGLNDRVSIEGECSSEELDQLYGMSHLMVSPSLYEGYGMAVVEGLSAGLPAVASSGGAMANTLPEEAGILIPPDDTEAFANAIRLMITNAQFYKQKRDGAIRARDRLHRWNDTASLIEKILQKGVKDG